MKELNAYLEALTPTPENQRMIDVLNWIAVSYPQFDFPMKWKQPTFVFEGTFIISFVVTKKHLSVTLEPYAMEKFREAILASGYQPTSMTIPIPWSMEVDYSFLKDLIEFSYQHKKGSKTYWYKN